MTYFIMIRGPLGIGKSTIAKRLTRALRGTYLSMDKIVDKNRVTKKPAKDGMMDTRNFLKANEVMLPIVRELLSKGKFAITDGCFYRKEQIVDIINKLGEDKVLVFDLKAPLKVCIERDKNRKLTYGSDAARVVYNAVSKFNYGIKIDTNGKTEEEVVKKILEYIPDN
ncbi:AAA family ATPase [Candidatus Woesearchaeota archaeon]|nr:AAA family ATPase [Candidatus Woesearchaeota archaeon]